MNFKEYCLLNQKNFDKVKSIEKHVSEILVFDNNEWKSVYKS